MYDQKGYIINQYFIVVVGLGKVIIGSNKCTEATVIPFKN